MENTIPICPYCSLRPRCLFVFFGGRTTGKLTETCGDAACKKEQKRLKRQSHSKGRLLLNKRGKPVNYPVVRIRTTFRFTDFSDKNMPTEKTEVHLSNGIKVSSGNWILGVSHCVTKPGKRLLNIEAAAPVRNSDFVGCRMIDNDGDLILLVPEIRSPALDDVPKFSGMEPIDSPRLTEGMTLHQAWWHHETERLEERDLVWDGANYVNATLDNGQSGSGLYLPDGKLVCTVEWTSGAVHAPVDIASMLEGYEIT